MINYNGYNYTISVYVLLNYSNWLVITHVKIILNTKYLLSKYAYNKQHLYALLDNGQGKQVTTKINSLQSSKSDCTAATRVSQTTQTHKQIAKQNLTLL